MIKSIYIIHESGICLFEKECSHDRVNKDLFSGYVKALICFAKEITNDVISEVRMEKRNIYYETCEKILVVIVSSPNINRKRLKGVFQAIMAEFILQYGDYLDHNILTREPFNSFSGRLDTILFDFCYTEKYLTISTTKGEKLAKSKL
ncbi:MAG: hypothetical protein JSV04_05240 [Candidatus Heimdallarchaeota archaeon]|nr:MAG: hypothetical protein JSV04_05240 [Candidatus Heimdallarchaeota archaeon]